MQNVGAIDPKLTMNIIKSPALCLAYSKRFGKQTLRCAFAIKVQKHLFIVA